MTKNKNETKRKLDSNLDSPWTHTTKTGRARKTVSYVACWAVDVPRRLINHSCINLKFFFRYIHERKFSISLSGFALLEGEVVRASFLQKSKLRTERLTALRSYFRKSSLFRPSKTKQQYKFSNQACFS